MSNTPDTAAALKYCTATMPAEDWCSYMAKTCQKIETQRDEARAEVERLRKRVAQLEYDIRGLKHLWVPTPPTPIPVATSPEIFEAHGLEWYRHTPGDKMPCDAKLKVELFTNEFGGYYSKGSITASCAWWKDDTKGSQTLIIGWRPADAPEKLPR